MILVMDTCALITYALAGELGTLKEILDGRGRWTVAVQLECARFFRDNNGPIMRINDILGPPLVSEDDDDFQRTLEIQTAIGGKETDIGLANLGEAHSLALMIRHRYQYPCFVSDDLDAIRQASLYGFATIKCRELLNLGVWDRLIKPDEAWSCYENLISARPSISTIPEVTDRDSFNGWLGIKLCDWAHPRSTPAGQTVQVAPLAEDSPLPGHLPPARQSQKALPASKQGTLPIAQQPINFRAVPATHAAVGRTA